MIMKVVPTDHGFASIDQETRLIAGTGGELVVLQTKDPDALIAACAAVAALLVQWAPITAAVIASLRRCKVIVRYGIAINTAFLTSAP